MIYNGQERGCPIRLNFFNNSTTIDWTLNPDIAVAYKNIIGYRNNKTSLRKGSLQIYSSNDILVFTRSLAGDTVLVIVNLRNSPAPYTAPAALTVAPWKNAFDGSNSPFTMPAQLSLQPYEYKVLEKK